MEKQTKNHRVQANLDDEMFSKLHRIMDNSNLENEPQAIRLIIKYFDEQKFYDRNKHLNELEE